MSTRDHTFIELTADKAEQNGPWHIAEVERNGIWRSSSTNSSSSIACMTRAGAFCSFFLQEECKGQYFVDAITTAPCKFFFKNKSDRDRFKEVYAEESQKSQRLIPDWTVRLRNRDEGSLVQAYFYFTDPEYLKRLKNDGFGTDARALYAWVKHNCVKGVWWAEFALVFDCAEDAALYKLKFFDADPPKEKKPQRDEDAEILF